MKDKTKKSLEACSENPHKITAVVLAGGRGSRFSGRDKGLIEYQGKPFVEHIIYSLETQVDEILISCNRNQALYETFGYTLINDTPYPSEGPLCAIAAALEHSKYELLQVVPCDSPILPDDLCRNLLTTLLKTDADIAYIESKGIAQPLFSMLKKTCLSSLQNFLDTGNRKTRAWMELQATGVFIDERENYFININTVEDLKELNQKL